MKNHLTLEQRSKSGQRVRLQTESNVEEILLKDKPIPVHEGANQSLLGKAGTRS